MDSLQKMSNSEFNTLANKTGFKSYRTKLCNDQTKRTEEIDKLVDSMMIANPDSLATMDPYSDEIIEPTIKSSLYRSIADEDGVFYIEGVKNVVNEAHVSGYSVVKTKAGNSEETLISKTRYVEQEKTKNIEYGHPKAAFFCSKRRVEATPTKIFLSAYTQEELRTKCVIEIKLAGFSNSIWGSRWKSYKTFYYLRNVVVGNGYFMEEFNSQDYSNNEYNGYTVTLNIGTFTSRELFYMNFSFDYSSRGTIEHGYGFYDSTDVINQNVGKC